MVVLYFLFLINAVAARANEPPLVFSIMRNGVELGQHEIRFNREGPRLMVEMQGQAIYKIATLVLYRYTTRRSETWVDGKLIAFESWTDDDGDIYQVTGRREGDVFQVTGPRGTVTIPGDAIPESFWNLATVRAPQVIDYKTGRPVPVTVTPGDVETIAACGEAVKARRYRLTMKEPHDLWYDENGRWVRMELVARDLSKIEFVLQ